MGSLSPHHRRHGSLETKEERDESHESGDHIINWHLSYIAQVVLQGEAYINNLREILRAEVIKMKSDTDFIVNKMPGSHRHLEKLEKVDRDVRILLDPLDDMADRLQKTALRASKRIV